MSLHAVAVVMVSVMVAVQIQDSVSECCNPDTGWLLGSGLHSLYARCGDRTKPTPCCGYGKCNFFCCNCDGGCRKRDRRKRQGEEEENRDHFKANDADGDGQISAAEARRWILAGGCGNPLLKVVKLDQEFQNLDKDENGFLGRDEIGG